MNNFMLDLETLSLKPTAAIMQIAVVQFDLNLGMIMPDSFLENVTVQSCLMHGMTVDQDTSDWWRHKTSDSAREQVMNRRALPLDEVLTHLDSWLGSKMAVVNDDPSTFQPLRVWAQGVAYDMPVMDNAYRAVGRTAPWPHRATRDSRTVIQLAADLGYEQTPRRDVSQSHTALGDCIDQIVNLHGAYQWLLKYKSS